MCTLCKCPSCGKATWCGCGMHIESVLRNVKEQDRCPNWKGGYHKPCGEVHYEEVHEHEGHQHHQY